MLRIIREGNVAHGGTALGGKVGALDVQILDDGDGIARLQRRAVAVQGGLTVFIFRGHTGFGPGFHIRFQVQHIQ